MVKNILSNFSRGFFVTIGRVIAIGFIAFLIYSFISKMPIQDIPVNSIIRGWLV